MPETQPRQNAHLSTKNANLVDGGLLKIPGQARNDEGEPGMTKRADLGVFEGANIRTYTKTLAGKPAFEEVRSGIEPL